MKVSHFSCLIINMNKYECLSYKYYVCNISIKYEYNCTFVWFTYLAFFLTVLSDIFCFFSGYSLFIFLVTVTVLAYFFLNICFLSRLLLFYSDHASFLKFQLCMQKRKYNWFLTLIIRAYALGSKILCSLLAPQLPSV